MSARVQRDPGIRERALDQFRDYLGDKGFRVDDNAINELRDYIMAEEKEEQVYSEIESRRRTEPDLALGFRRLAAVSMEIATSNGRKTVNDEDVKEALKKVFCSVWPFCSRRS